MNRGNSGKQGAPPLHPSHEGEFTSPAKGTLKKFKRIIY